MAVSSELNKVFFDFPFLVPEYFALVKITTILKYSGDPNTRHSNNGTIQLPDFY